MKCERIVSVDEGYEWFSIIIIIIIFSAGYTCTLDAFHPIPSHPIQIYSYFFPFLSTRFDESLFVNNEKITALHAIISFSHQIHYFSALTSFLLRSVHHCEFGKFALLIPSEKNKIKTR